MTPSVEILDLLNNLIVALPGMLYGLSAVLNSLNQRRTRPPGR